MTQTHEVTLRKRAARNLAKKTSDTADVLKTETRHIAAELEAKTVATAAALKTDIADEERIKMFVAAAVFVLLGAVYWFNANNTSGKSIPTDLLVAGASLIVGYYFRGKQ